MDRLEVLLANISLFSPNTRAFLLERAASMDDATREDFIASLASYKEEREQLQTEYNENKRLLNEELRSEVSRLTNAVITLDKELKHFAQSMEEDPEHLLA